MQARLYFCSGATEPVQTDNRRAVTAPEKQAWASVFPHAGELGHYRRCGIAVPPLGRITRSR